MAAVKKRESGFNQPDDPGFPECRSGKRFQQSYLEGNLQLSRACHLLAIFFYWLVGLWDALVIDPSRLHIWIWVILAVTLIFLAGLTASYAALKLYARYWQPLFAFYVFMTGTGFTMVTVLSRPSYPVYNFMASSSACFLLYVYSTDLCLGL